MPYKRLILELYNERITLTPTNLFIIRDNGMTDFKVIIYKMDYLELTSGRSASADIPYYVSDGHTNNLRANMLYPFMSFNMGANLNSPFLASREGLLFKYSIGTNINTNSIEEWVRHMFVEYNNTHGFNGVQILQNLDAASKNHTEGVTSILRRLTNLLDYFISILSPDVLSYPLRDIRCYRPIYNPAQVANKYNIDFCDTSSVANELDKYKELILRALRDQIDHLLRYRVFRTDDIALGERLISRVEFNNIMSICTNPAYAQNVANYVEISRIFHRNIKAYVIQLLQTPIAIVNQSLGGIADNSFTNFMTQFNRLLNDGTILNSPSAAETLSTTITRWGAICRQAGGMEKLENENTINSIPNVDMSIETLIKNNDIRLVNGNTITEKLLKRLYKEYKKKYLSIRKNNV